MKNFFFGLCVSIGMAVSALAQAANPDDITGYWRTIDDETGFSLAMIRIEKVKDGTYLGTIVEVIQRSGYVPFETCQRCPPPFTDRKVLQMPLLWNLKADPRKDLNYTNGYVIDPNVGKIYAVDIKLSASGRQILLRGKVIGAGFLNRTQVWLRDANYTPK